MGHKHQTEGDLENIPLEGKIDEALPKALDFARASAQKRIGLAGRSLHITRHEGGFAGDYVNLREGVVSNQDRGRICNARTRLRRRSTGPGEQSETRSQMRRLGRRSDCELVGAHSTGDQIAVSKWKVAC